MSRRYTLSMSGAVLLVGATAGVLMNVAPAQAAAAGKAEVKGLNVVEYRAGAGAVNRVVLSRTGRTVTIDDAVAVRAGKGCVAVPGDRTKVRCTTAYPTANIKVHLGNRNDTLVDRSNTILLAWGDAGNDTITGGSSSDWLRGGAGNDRLSGLGGYDDLDGGPGRDVLIGGNSEDWLHGRSGNDTLYGGAGRDGMEGGTGADTLWGGAGDDEMLEGATADALDVFHGGPGFDGVSYFARTKPVTIDADGVRRDDGQRGERDTIGTDVEFLAGGKGNDRLFGTARRDRLNGYEGNDEIRGGAGNDRLEGDKGVDRIYGGAGDDYLDGGSLGVESNNRDRLDGGANATRRGDECIKAPRVTRVNCER